MLQSTADPNEFKDEAANSATKTEKTIIRKRSISWTQFIFYNMLNNKMISDMFIFQILPLT